MALQQAATDPVTGAIDMDLIQTGVSASERVARARLAQEIKALLLGARRSPGSASVTWQMQSTLDLRVAHPLCALEGSSFLCAWRSGVRSCIDVATLGAWWLGGVRG